MSALGLKGCPKADVAVFADTGDEPQWVYQHLEFIKEWSTIPVHIVQHGSLAADVIRRGKFIPIPVYSKSERGKSMLRRQCTREYKITPIEKFIRGYMGYRKGQRIKKNVRCLLGISIDEASRMKPSRTRWVTNSWPLVDAEMRRSDCLALLREHKIPEPSKSSCVYCPFHSDAFWIDLRKNHPDEWKRAVDYDEKFRNLSMSGSAQPVYIHKSLKPLSEVNFTGSNADWFDNECEGMCGV